MLNFSPVYNPAHIHILKLTHLITHCCYQEYPKIDIPISSSFTNRNDSKRAEGLHNQPIRIQCYYCNIQATYTPTVRGKVAEHICNIQLPYTADQVKSWNYKLAYEK
jgi:hypothetical protein